MKIFISKFWNIIISDKKSYLECTIARYPDMRNVHRMFITYIHIEHRNPETQNTYDFLIQVRIFLLPLSLKVFRHREKEAQSFYADFSICPLPPTLVAPATRPLHWLWRASESRPSSSDRKNKLTDFSQIPQILRARFRCVTLFELPSPFPISGFYCDISEWHVRSACTRGHLRSCLHLANPCTEPKGSQPN